MNAAAFASELLAWYRRRARDLPWRRTRDPYLLWVSEIMLQQTQVNTVIPYYERFVARFPSVAALAAASEEAVLKAWEGLGYYARARNLHRAAHRLAAAGAGFPREFDAVLALPGVGRSTAGAILSFAFDQPHPVLDGNVRRVLCRLAAITDDPRAPATERRLWGLAGELLDRHAPGLFNQGMMELGALVCTPRHPECVACPVVTHCTARRQGRAEEIPASSRRRPLPHHQVAVGVIWRGEPGPEGELLVTRRKSEGLLGGLWEFPGGKCEPGEAPAAAVKREIAEELGIAVAVGASLPPIRHAYTHFKVILHPFHCRYLAGDPRALGCAEWRWVRPGDLRDLPFPAANQPIIQTLLHPSISSDTYSDSLFWGVSKRE